MRALDPEVVTAVWIAVEGLIPDPVDTHPLGTHRARIPDRVCFEGILIRLVTGCSWVSVEHLLGGRVSDTTLRTRRNEWITAGVFDRLVDEALAAYDRIINLDLSDVAIDGTLQKAPCGGEGTGRNPADRGKTGWKLSLCTDRAGIPIGWVTTPANRHDVISFEPTIAAVAARGFLPDIGTLHLDKGYDAARVHDTCTNYGLNDVICPPRRRRGQPEHSPPYKIDLRWPVERTASWISDFGQLRRNTDRHTIHRLAQLALAITLIITAKLIDWRNRWSPTTRPIR